MKLKKITAVLLAGTMMSAILLSGCGDKINANAVVATYGDQEISLGYANFVAHYNQATYDSMFVSYYGQDYWSNEQYADEDGKTMEESVKDYIMEEIEMNCLLADHMSDYNVEITDEDQKAISAAAAEFMDENTKEAIKKMGATVEYIEDMLYYTTVSSRMREAIEATADVTVDEQECARRTFSYFQIDLTGHEDEDGNFVEYTDDEKAAIVDNLEEIEKLAESDFEAAAESDNYEVKTYSYGVNEKSEEDGGFCEAVIKAADLMKEGEVSTAIEGTDCYYIIRLDSEDDKDAAESAKNAIISERKSALYTEVTDGYKENSEFEVNEEEWAKVKFTNLFTLVQDDDSSASAE